MATADGNSTEGESSVANPAQTGPGCYRNHEHFTPRHRKPQAQPPLLDLEPPEAPPPQSPPHNPPTSPVSFQHFRNIKYQYNMILMRTIHIVNNYIIVICQTWDCNVLVIVLFGYIYVYTLFRLLSKSSNLL